MIPFKSQHTARFAKSFCHAIVVGLLWMLVAAPAQAQNDDDVVRVESNLVQLNVGVADSRGYAVTNLSRNDFVVYEDDVRQPIIGFASTAAPFSLVFLLDVSGSTIPFRATLKQAALRFIDALAPEDRVAVVAFNDKTNRLTRFTSDRTKIGWAISRAEGRGGTNLYDALNFALAELAGEGKRRKAVVVLTDGVDSKAGRLDRLATGAARTDEEAIAAVKPGTSTLLNSVLDQADRQGVTIYPLALPDGREKRQTAPTPQQTAIYTAARARLETIAGRTGGRLHDIRRLEDMGRLYAEVAADLRTLYSIAYQPSGERTRDGRWRAIRVEVTRPALLARTRPGYYAR